MPFFFFLLGASTALQAATWQYHAARLSGRSAWVHQSSVQALKKTPDIETKLTQALGTADRYLALDAISALSLHKLMPALQQASYDDELGAIHLTLNALLDSSNVDELTQFYVERLADAQKPLSMPARMAILDVLGRLRYELSDAQVAAELRSASFEVRSAALYYIRLIQKNRKKAAYWTSLRTALKDKAIPLRLQAAYTLRDRTYPKPPTWDEAVGDCLSDAAEEVRAACAELKR